MKKLDACKIQQIQARSASYSVAKLISYGSKSEDSFSIHALLFFWNMNVIVGIQIEKETTEANHEN
jgi:hypothetical protein